MTEPPPARDTLIQIVDAAVARAARQAGAHLVCRPGCAACCHGVFAISGADAARLRAGWEELRVADPARAAQLRQRVVASAERLRDGFPGDAETGLLADFDDPAQGALAEAFDEFGNEEPCPVLDPATGTCDLYPYRPMMCRTFGPPLRDADGHLGHCELCFTQASEEEVLAAVVDPAAHEAWQLADEVWDDAHGAPGQTVIAFALRGV